MVGEDERRMEERRGQADIEKRCPRGQDPWAQLAGDEQGLCVIGPFGAVSALLSTRKESTGARERN